MVGAWIQLNSGTPMGASKVDADSTRGNLVSRVNFSIKFDGVPSAEELEPDNPGE
jgi:hypothetical protein